jgi:pSer/pThr/pTyr-binding forkhead associated (FHA) protein
MPPPLPQQPPAQAWLASRDGRTYQLYRGETLIGRSADNHIYITDDTTVSKVHAKIVEQNNHFRLYDLGSTNGTRVNGQWVRQPVLLQSNDEIQLGDRTVFRFIKT